MNAMRTSLVLAALAAAGAVSGCGGVSKALGVSKVAPDEFRVITKAPLVIPPDYSLRPPRPDEPRPQDLAAGADARAQVYGQDVGVRSSEGEKLLVAKAGAAAVDPTIRSQVDFEGAALLRKPEALSNQVMDYGKTKAETPPADAAAEKAQLDQQEAARRATGGGPITIQRGDGKSKLPGL